MNTHLLRKGLVAGFALLGAAAGLAAVPTRLIQPAGPEAESAMRNSTDAPAVPANGAPADEPLSGNPLWHIALKQLSATRERPIFSPSRRPPPAAVAAAPYVPPRATPKPVGPERPMLSLVGTIVGGNEGFGIFLDQSTNKVVRLKTGEAHNGWILSDVRGRETTLQKDRETVALTLPVPTAAAVAPTADDASGRRDRR